LKKLSILRFQFNYIPTLPAISLIVIAYQSKWG